MKVSGTVKISNDKKNNSPRLEPPRTTATGKTSYSGLIYWQHGTYQDKPLYTNIQFKTYDEAIYELFKENPKSSFEIAGNLSSHKYTDKIGNEKYLYSIFITNASLYQEAKHWQD